MATTYDKASLVMIPSGYKDDKLYSIKPTDGSGDFTFSRDGAGASPATRVNASGLIEKGRTNEILQSNQFDTTWGPSSGISVTGGQSGYDGSSDAWLLERSDTSARYINQNITLSNAVYSYSVYAKADSVDWLYMWSFNGTGSVNVYFDLANGLVGTQSGTIDANIESVGGGWYRCSMSYNNNIAAVRLYPAAADGSITGGISPAGIFIQDAQVENGLVATDYIETTTAPVSAGLLGDMPRLDYSGGATCPSLLLEPSRVNSLPYSEYPSAWDVKSNISIQSNEGTSPEGVVNASNIYPTATGASFLYQTLVYTSGNAYTYSVFAKANGKDYLQIATSGASWASNVWCTFDLALGATDNNGFESVGIEDYGNGWYRCYVKETSISTSSSRMVIGLVSNANAGRLSSVTANGTDGVLIYGVVSESSSYPTSYIPTYGSASTRAVDAAVNSLGTSYFPTAGFSVFLEGDTTYDSITNFADLYQIAGTSAQLRLETRTSGRIHIQQGNMVTSGDNFNAYNLCATTAKKICLTFSPTQMNAYVDGALVNSFNGAYTWDITDLNMAMQTSSISYKQTLVFPSVLTSSEALALTTI